MGRRKCKMCRREANETITLFRFPLGVLNKSAWAEFCKVRVQDVKNFDRLCSMHFDRSSFKLEIEAGRRAVLKPNARPTIAVVSDKPVPKYKFGEDSSDLNGGKMRSIICCICGRLSTGTHVFRFPNDPNLLQDWLNFCGMNREDFRPNSSKICINHFKATDFLKRTSNSQRLLLKKGITPSRNKPNEECIVTLPFEVKFLSEGDEETENRICSNHVSPTSTSPHRQIYPSLMSDNVSLKNEMGAYEDNSLPTLSIRNGKRSFPRYLNDITLAQCRTSEERLILEIAKRDLTRLRRRKDTLAQENRRLKAENIALKGIITELRNKN